jgi:hypothetical protein
VSVGPSKPALAALAADQLNCVLAWAGGVVVDDAEKWNKQGAKLFFDEMNLKEMTCA